MPGLFPGAVGRESVVVIGIPSPDGVSVLVAETISCFGATTLPLPSMATPPLHAPSLPSHVAAIISRLASAWLEMTRKIIMQAHTTCLEPAILSNLDCIFHVSSEGAERSVEQLQSCVSSTTPAVKFLGGDLRRVSATIYIGAEHCKGEVCYVYVYICAN